MANVNVYGAGIYGLCLAWQLLEAGEHPRVFTHHSPLAPDSSSVGGSRIFRFAYFEDPFYVPLMQSAFRLWRDLEAHSQQTLLEQTGVLYAGKQGDPLLDGVRKSADLHDLRIDAPPSPPQINLPAAHKTLRETDGGFLYSDRIIHSLLGLLDEAGVEIITGHSQVPSEHGLVAIGPNMAALCPDWHLSISTQNIVWASGIPADLPVFGIAEGGEFLYGIPAHADCLWVKVGEHAPGPPGHEGQLASIQNRLARYFRNARVERTALCRYTNSTDGHFRVDWIAPRQLGLSCCSGHGFKFAPAIAKAAVEMFRTGQRPPELDPFRSK